MRFAAIWLDEYILDFAQLFFFSHRPDRLLIRFDGNAKIRFFNLVRQQVDGTLIPKLRQAVYVSGQAMMAIDFNKPNTTKC